MEKQISKDIYDQIFRKHSKKIKVFLRSNKEESSRYDKFRDVPHSKTLRNYITVKGMIKQITANSLIYRELGLKETGAQQLIVKNNQAECIKKADKIEIGSKEYTLWNDATGSRFQITDLPFNYKKIILFRKKT